MNQTKNIGAQLLIPPMGGRGAKKYITPRIEWIPLDSDISLALESSPPLGPSETNLSPEFLQHEPFNNPLT